MHHWPVPRRLSQQVACLVFPPSSWHPTTWAAERRRRSDAAADWSSNSRCCRCCQLSPPHPKSGTPALFCTTLLCFYKPLAAAGLRIVTTMRDCVMADRKTGNHNWTTMSDPRVLPTGSSMTSSAGSWTSMDAGGSGSYWPNFLPGSEVYNLEFRMESTELRPLSSVADRRATGCRGFLVLQCPGHRSHFPSVSTWNKSH